MKILSTGLSLALLTTTSCAPVPGPQTRPAGLANSTWRVVSVSGDRLSKSGSTMRFGSTTFTVHLPCTSVSGDFTQDGNILRTANVKTRDALCDASGQERYVAGKLSQGQVIDVTARGVILQSPPDYIELERL